MARRKQPPEPTMRVSFQAARIAPQCLTDAYERLVPIPRRPTQIAARREALPSPTVAVDRPMRRRAEHG
jgi:hypothetical protein